MPNSESKPLFSIIMPVYNTSAYLEGCIQSMIDQDESNFEIIAVDDGSTDNSLEILNEIAKSEPRLKVYSKENGGQGTARNLGMAKACGDYVLFVDSDDTVAANLLSTALDHLSDPELDIVSFGIAFQDDSGRVIAKRAPKTCFTSYGRSIFVDAMLDRNFLTSACNKVYRRSLLLQNAITFPDLRAYEDSVFSRKVASHAKKVLYLKETFYFALTRNDSTSRGMGVQSFSKAKDVIELERELFCPADTNFTRKLAFRGHVAHFFAYLLVLSAFRIDDPKDRAHCRKIADEAGFSDCAADSEAVSILKLRVKVQIFLARHPKLLRTMALTARRFGFTPY